MERNIFKQTVRIDSIIFNLSCILFVSVCLFFLFLLFFKTEQHFKSLGVIDTAPSSTLFYASANGLYKSNGFELGDSVSKGDVVYKILTERYYSRTKRKDKEIIEQINMQVQLLNGLIESTTSKYELEKKEKLSSKEQIQLKINQNKIKNELINKRLEIQRDILDSLQELELDGYISSLDVKRQMDTIMVLQSDLESSSNEMLILTSQLESIESSLELLRENKNDAINRLEIELSKQNERKIEVLSNSVYLKRAETKYEISSIYVNDGDRVEIGDPIMSVSSVNYGYKVTTYLDSNKVRKLKLGQSATIEIETGNSDRKVKIPGYINKINRNPEPTSQNEAGGRYKVEILPREDRNTGHFKGIVVGQEVTINFAISDVFIYQLMTE